MKKLLRYLLITLFLLVLTTLSALFFLNKKIPQSQAGPEAEQMADQMAEAVNSAAFDSTHWIRWTYAKRNTFIWDKRNGRFQITWKNIKVNMNTTDFSGKAWKNGEELHGQDQLDALNEAWKRFCNDTYWLIAPNKVFDQGVQRSVAPLENGKNGLLVQYTHGGVTPGDSYLWEMDDAGVPIKVNMWVKILPIGGISATWENWVTLSTGAKIATRHRIGGLLTVDVTDLEAGTGAVMLD